MQTQNKVINLFEMLSIMFSPDFDKSEWEFSWGTQSDWFNLYHYEGNRQYLSDREVVVFRKIQKTQSINGFSVPVPVKDWDELEVNSDYYFPSFYRKKMIDCLKVRKHQDSVDLNLLERGLVFKTKEDALAVAKAMLGIDPYK